ncbi:MAG TPA: hypothetical protein VGM28_03905 [Candidatus Limnocylindrales bacterium]
MLTAALALVALPGLVGSRAPRPIEPIPASAFQQFTIRADESRSSFSIGGLDAAHLAAATIEANARIAEPGAIERPTVGREAVRQPAAAASSSRKAPPGALAGTIHGSPKYTLSGGATFYDNGTTAMRLPRGTVVKICGPGGCIVRVVNDYGPQKKSRVVDLYRPDFFRICGCPSYAGTTHVTVYVY